MREIRVMAAHMHAETMAVEKAPLSEKTKRRTSCQPEIRTQREQASESMCECAMGEDPTSIYSASTCARHERRAGTERTWEVRAVQFIGGVQYCFHFDRSSHDAFLKCISRGTQALREKSTHSAGGAHEPDDAAPQNLEDAAAPPGSSTARQSLPAQSPTPMPSTGSHRLTHRVAEAGGGLCGATRIALER